MRVPFCLAGRGVRRAAAEVSRRSPAVDELQNLVDELIVVLEDPAVPGWFSSSRRTICFV
jgi:hypothetical protein